jgi:hypothetical protein
MPADQAEAPEHAALLRRIEQLQEEVTYWRQQHDAVMDDWRADLAQLAPPAGGEPDHRHRQALDSLLRFYDPRTGAVAGKVGPDLLSDAFAAALRSTGEVR